MNTVSHIRKVESLARAVQELALAKDVNRVMLIIRETARELTGSDGATFILREGLSCYYADESAIAPLWKGKRFPMSTCISGWSMSQRQMVVIENVFQDDRIPHAIYRETFVKSLVIIPVGIGDPIAAIGNYWASGHVPDEADLSLLQSLADVTAVTLENIKVHTHLEQLVSDRTRALEEANKDLESYAYSISHDLRAPLRAINGFLEIISDEHGSNLDGQALEYIRKAQDNALHMSLLIESLFSLFKMGRREIQKSWLPMKRLVTEITANIRKESAQQVIEFEISDIPGAMGDQVLIRQVWQNLIDNAVKYTSRKDKARIEIGGSHNDAGVVYYVKDNGAGFDMRYADKLFGVFQRLHTQREFKGSGVGLAIVQKIINKHGGRVWAEARVEEGATFFFTLP